MWPCTVCMDIPLQPTAGFHMSYYSACVLSLLTKPICQIMTWNRAISVNEGTFSPFPFHTTAYISPWENRLTQWDHYCLFTSLFCIWRAGKPVVVTHKQMHNAHNAGTAGLWSACTRVWLCVCWPGVLSLAPHDLPLTSDLLQCTPLKKIKMKEMFCIYLQHSAVQFIWSNPQNPFAFLIKQPENFRDSVVWPSLPDSAWVISLLLLSLLLSHHVRGE